MRFTLLFSIALMLSPLCASDSAPKTKTIEETIPVTMANLRGHQSLYSEGWFIVTSTEQALAYAKKHSIDSSASAIKKLNKNLSTRTQDFTSDLTNSIQSSANTTKRLYSSGSENTQAIFSNTHEFAQDQWEFAEDISARSWQTFSQGYLYLAERTEDSRNGFKNVPKVFFDGVTEDFSELASGIKEFNNQGSLNIKKNWERAFDQAHTEFNDAYEASGEASNSLSGLWTLLGGYIGALWEGLIKPTGKTAWQVSAFTVVVAGEAIFLPIASTYILTKNTLLSTGSALYYAGKTGIEVISPTVEGGFLASLALVSAGTVPVTYVAGTTVGVINQVGTTVVAPTAGVTQGVATTTANTLKYGTLVTYDALSATTKVFINQFKSGVVLGYNALTAIPSHLLLGSVNTAYFLVADGPKLAIASIKGEVSFQADNTHEQRFQAGQLPVGTVMDLQALQNQGHPNIEIVTEDPVIIENVISNISKDAKR